MVNLPHLQGITRFGMLKISVCGAKRVMVLKKAGFTGHNAFWHAGFFR